MPTTFASRSLPASSRLLSNLAVIGFIYLRTHDEAVATVHRQVIEQGKVLADVYRSGGHAALDDAIDDTMTYADPQTVIALVAPDRREIKGNLETIRASVLAPPEGYRTALVRLRGQTTPREAALVTHRLTSGQWLVSGRIAGEGFAIRDTLERSLFIALLVAGLLGLLCGILAHYVGRRISDFARVATRISPRDLHSACPFRARATRSTGSPRRSTRCSTGSAG